ncbi:hypothetical protein AUC43_15775 [Hymenobacter sedentarius]|uniref:Uncharacterized protein n=2 Tax=Hymenobacter sedentarius TaxID=1411621 RepID=A0A0U3K1H0_9BACT|nr:hypothetical protein AUC43_15775 [Hymenobacter sedentarius]
MLFMGLLPLVVGCSLTSSEVEPNLPTGRISGGNTLVYQAEGLPVVAHNDSSFGTIISSIFGGKGPVSGYLDFTNQLVIHGVDSQNPPAAGQKQHVLHLELPAFQGPGTYALGAPETFYQVSVFNSDKRLDSPLTFYPVSAPGARVTVTQWDAASRHLQGTFSVKLVEQGTGQSVALTDGRFDLILDQ